MNRIENIYNKEIPKKITYIDIVIMLKNIECPEKKFLPIVRKILKQVHYKPLWYEFLDEYKETRKGEKYNFRCCPTTENYYDYHCLDIKFKNGIVKVINSYVESV